MSIVFTSMDDSQRIKAPKPIKSHSNVRGIKINIDIDTKIIPPFTYTSPSILFQSKVSNEFKPKRLRSFGDVKRVEISDFEDDIQRSDSCAELLSILYNESTTAESMSYYQSDGFEMDEFRTSLPPKRTKNPVLKNFEGGDVEFDVFNFFESNGPK
jgi:hypothetical protein